MIDYLLERDSLLALPRLFESGKFEPLPLGQQVTAEQILFRQPDVELVRASVRPVVRDEGHSLVLPSLGLTIEWTRTSRVGANGYEPGRLYFVYDSPASSEITRSLNRLMTAVVRYIRTSSPKRSVQRYPFYVGPDLSELVDHGEAKVMFANGNEIALEANTTALKAT
jgi:hypothetical protein